jgi:hypothetical protein
VTAEELVIGAAITLILALAVWRVVLQIKIVRLFVRRLFGRHR